jgi:hypothetical protein
VLRRPVPPEYRGDLFFGWVLLTLFLVQVATGILLSIYYEPSPVAVAQSVELLMRDVDWGWLMRGVHHWASHAMIVLVLVHLLWLFVRGRYRAAGAPGWTIAVLLLGFALAADVVAALGHRSRCHDRRPLQTIRGDDPGIGPLKELSDHSLSSRVRPDGSSPSGPDPRSAARFDGATTSCSMYGQPSVMAGSRAHSSPSALDQIAAGL